MTALPVSHLSKTDLDHLRIYLPPALIEPLQIDFASPSTSLISACVTHLTTLLETTASHLPDYVVESVLHNPVPGLASGQFVDGTLLFADISGFTAMSERLNRIGREGAEEITAVVNRYFSMMLTILHKYSGQLIKFGGDALLGLFSERPFSPDTGPLQHSSATRAAQAALHMQNAMSEFAETSTSQGTFPLRMKVGLHKGRFFAAQLGSPQNMEYALFGQDVNATAATESAASAGQVLLDQATYTAIDVNCTAVPLPHDNHYLLITQLDPIAAQTPPPINLLPNSDPSLDTLRHAVTLLDALTPYLPVGLLSRIASDPNAPSLAGEHRLVGILFANVHGLGKIADRLGPGQEAQIVASLNHYFVSTSQALEQYGGVINKIDLYDHGDKLLVLFGAPIAHEDDAERAARAALGMQTVLSQLQTALPPQANLPDLHLSQHIGISYGYVFAGYVGSDWRHEYTVMGDQVNLSARLMAAAGHQQLATNDQRPTTILISSNVRRKVQAMLDLEPQGEVSLKGKSEPVPIFTVRGARAVPETVRGLGSMRSPLVGRAKEWQQLATAVTSLRNNRGQIITLLGEAGLGKSRLVEELRQHISPKQGINILEGRCLSYTESASYWVFQELLRQAINLHANEEPDVALHTLRHALDEIWPPNEIAANLPYLANFLNLPLDDSLQEKIRFLDAEALQRRTFVALRAMLEAYAQGHPLILVLDDIHWIDHASAQLLEFLMPVVNQLPMMWLLIFRPERHKSCWDIREKAAREFNFCHTEISLKPLERDGSQALLQNLVGKTDWPLAMQDLLLDRTEGNPLYLEEVLRALINDEMLVNGRTGQWEIVGDVASLKVPDTLQGVMMARLDRLPEPNRWTAQIASIVGRTFPYDVLSNISTGEQEQTVTPRLVQLQQSEIIEETQRAPELVYNFLHGLMQEVCYSSLAVRARREYHCRIAHYLEANRAGGWGDSRSILPVIAHHAYVGQDWPIALRYQIQAGWQARQLFANHEAIDHFTKALECTTHMPEQDTLHSRLVIQASLGELLVNTSRYEEAEKQLENAYALATNLRDQDTQAAVCRWMARSFELRGAYEQAFAWIARGLESLQQRQTPESAQLLLIAGLIHIRQGDYDQAIAQCRQALTIAEQLGEITARARAYNLLGITYLRSDSQEAIAHFQQAYGLYQQAGDLYGQATSHNLVANAYFNLGQWQQADEDYQEARRLFEQIGDVYNLAMADNNLGGIALNRGQLDAALAFYREARQSLGKITASDYVLGIVEMNLGATYIRRRELGQANQALNAAQDYFQKTQTREFLPELLRHQGRAALLAGKMYEASSAARKALHLARELAMRGEEGGACALLGEIAINQHAFEGAAEWLTQSVAILEEAGEEYMLARSRLWLAQAYAGLNNRKRALALLVPALETFERLAASMDVTAVRTLQASIQSS
ncbi:MAG: AAA family ATPase [Ardenticatenaceae bacterium]|nr:AAA family ATPase [Ardenticatenaceae bacterium]